MKTVKTLTSALVLTLGLGLMTGCASSSKYDQLKAMVTSAEQAAANAQRSADEAKRAAATAQQTADQAKGAAGTASATADRALRAAQDSERCCVETNDKIDRMFKRSMYK